MKNILLYAVALFTAIGCKVSPLAEDVTAPTDKLVSVTVQAALSSQDGENASDTRVSVTPDAENDAWKTAWEEGDVLTLIPVASSDPMTTSTKANPTPNLYTLSNMSTDEDGIATFSGTEIAEGEYDVYCIKDYTIEDENGFMINYSAQVAKEDIASNMPMQAVGTLTVSADDANDYTAPIMYFKHIAQVAELNLDYSSALTGDDSYTLTSITVSGSNSDDSAIEGLETRIKVSIEEISLSSTSSSSKVYCYLPAFTVAVGGELQISTTLTKDSEEFSSKQTIKNEGSEDVVFEAGKHNSIYAKFTEIKTPNWIDYAAEKFGETAYDDATFNYTISTPEELALLAKLINDGTIDDKSSKITFTLTNNIDLTGKEWTAIGTSSKKFTSTFDGAGYTVSGLYINQPSKDYQGLFGYVYKIVKNVTVSGSVIGGQNTGGVVGYATTNAYVINCCNLANVDGNENVGGVVGYLASNSSVINCYNAASVKNLKGRYTGGVVGYVYSSAKITNCYNTGLLQGDSFVGGIVGKCAENDITNCYWANNIADSEAEHGIGTTTQNENKPSDAGAMSMTSSAMQKANFVTLLNNGAYAYNQANTSKPLACAWKAVSGDFPAFGTGDAPKPLFEGMGTQTNPYLIKTAEDMVTISTQVNDEANTFEGMYLKVANDIDLSSVANTFATIGKSTSNTFKGIFDGGGYAITNLAINGTTYNSYNALFGYINNATIKNVSVAGSVTVEATSVNAAGLVAYAYQSTIINCSSLVTVDATVNQSTVGAGGYTGHIGGICANSYKPKVINCYNTGELKVSYGEGSSKNYTVYIGGVVGRNGWGTVENCYNADGITITGGNSKEDVGGVVGYNGETVTNCYWNSDDYSGNGVGDGSQDGVTELDAAELKDFAPTLTDNAAEYNGGNGITEKACGWKAGNSFPELDYTNLPE